MTISFFLVLLYVIPNEAWNEELPKVVTTEAEPVELRSHITSFTLRTSIPVPKPVNVSLVSNNPNIAYPILREVTFYPEEGTTPKMIFLYGNAVGKTCIDIRYNSSEIQGDKNPYKVYVSVIHSLKIRSTNIVIGWIYFVVWSISFYPQVFENFMRKSVIGLNFDFLCYNITGFIAYSVYNAALFWIVAVQEQYFNHFGGSVIPVQPNDVFFALHATLVTILTIIQCFIYERGEQKISLIAKILVTIMWLFAGGLLIAVAMKAIDWLSYLTSFSYIKLAVTLIKYIPQAYMNYGRKSTVGWSIGFVYADFIGGVLSIIQIFFLSYNNNQWNSIFGNFTKFGLAAISVFFDVLFFFQHYWLYRDPNMKVSVSTDMIIMSDEVTKSHEKEVVDIIIMSDEVTKSHEKEVVDE